MLLRGESQSIRERANRYLVSALLAFLPVIAILFVAYILKVGFGSDFKAAEAATGVNKMISYQAKMTDAIGATVPDGTYYLTIRIYDSASGGTCLYTASGTSCGAATSSPVTVTNGILSFPIGDTSVSNALTLDFNSDTYYLGVQINNDSEMTPRKRIGGAGYAINSAALGGFAPSQTGGSGAYVPVTTANGDLYITKRVLVSSTIYSSGSGTSTFASGATFATANGNVGIGTSTPSQKLSVVGNISNLTDAASPVKQIATAIVGFNPYGIYVSGKYAYVLNSFDYTMSVVDISNPAAPTQIATTAVGANPGTIYVSGRYAYITNQDDNTMSVVDISNPAAPTQIATTVVGSAPSGIYVEGHYAYVTTASDGKLSVVDISNPAAPTQIATTAVGSSPYRIYVSGRYAYLSNFNTNNISVVDISNPAAPKKITTAAVGSHPYGIYVSGRYAYVVNSGSNTMSVVDISNPLLPAQVATTAVGSVPLGIFVSGRYAYVTNASSNNISVVDISNPLLPTQVATTAVGLNPQGGIFVSGRYAYVTNYGDSTISVVDISGAEFSSIIAHSAEVGNLQARNDIIAGGNIEARSSLFVGQGGILSNGPLAISSTTTPSYFGYNVGIGTTNPGYQLTVAGAIGTSSTITSSGSGTSTFAGAMAVGVSTTAVPSKLYVDGSVLFQGTGGTPISGGGTRMMWVPDKGAFRAGAAFINEWDDINIGTNSFATGDQTIASGFDSAAFGHLTTASNSYAVAIGGYTTASGFESFAMGDSSVASNDATIAMGSHSFASGVYSISIGVSTLASGQRAVAIGDTSAASGQNSFAIGHYASSTATNAITIGSGVGSGASALTNSTANSLMIGFNSTIPTLYIGPSAGAGKTGNIGIGTSGATNKLSVYGGNISVASGTATTTIGANFFSIASSTADALGKFYVDSSGNTSASGTIVVNGSGTSSLGYGLTMAANGGNVGIGTVTPAAGLTVTNKSVLFNGTTGDTPASSGGTLLEWIPVKAAFRAGQITGTHWDDANIGTNSFAAGYNTMATGTKATVFGDSSQAGGSSSFAAGYLNLAYGIQSTAFGSNSNAFGTNSFAAGSAAQAMGSASVAMGAGASATGSNAVALGSGGHAGGYSSFAVGSGAYAYGDDSVVIGYNGLATGRQAIALGNGTATNYQAIALGYATASGSQSFAANGAIASGDFSTAIGSAASSTGSFGTALGNQVTAGGNGSFAGGAYAGAIGQYSVAIGYNPIALGPYSLALGDSSSSTGSYATAIGYFSNAGGIGSFAAGYQSAALGYYSMAIGYQSTAQYDHTIALGYLSSSTAASAITLGDQNTAGGAYSFAAGGYNKAGGSGSTALGYQATAQGDYSLAFGLNSVATNTYSIALGGFSGGQNSFSVYSNAYGQTSVAMGGGYARGSDSFAVGAIVYADGTNSIAMGYNQSNATNTMSMAFGDSVKSGGHSSVAMGSGAAAYGDYSIALGGNGPTARGPYSLAAGSSASADKDYAVAIGYLASASGIASVALGDNAMATNTDSIAIGANAKSGGSQSYALGGSAYGSNSFAIGGVTVNGNYSIGIGAGTGLGPVNSNNTIALLGGNVGIASSSPQYLLSMESGNAGGYYSVSDSSWHTGSTRAIKQDITPITDSERSALLTMLDNLQVNRYHFINDVKQNGDQAIWQYGIIADDSPELLTGKNHDSVSLGSAVQFLITNEQTLRWELEALEQGWRVSTTTLQLFTSSTIYSDNTGTSTFAGSLAVGGTITQQCGSGCVDIAEQFTSSELVEAGDIVSVTSIGPQMVNSTDVIVEKTKGGYASNIVGIVSSNPAITLSGSETRIGGNGVSETMNPPVALAGRVPVKVTDENGSVKAGDLLVSSSSTPGAAMKWDATKYQASNNTYPAVIGMALTNFDSANGENGLEPDKVREFQIEVMSLTGQIGIQTVHLGKVLVLIKNNYIQPSGISADGLGLSVSTDVKIFSTRDFDMGGKDILNVKSISSASGNWSIDETGHLISEKITADEYEVDARKKSELDPTVGRARVPAGMNEILVNNNRVHKNSNIVITFYGNPGGTWWISDQEEGWFKVTLSVGTGSEVDFRYWIQSVIEDETNPISIPAAAAAPAPVLTAPIPPAETAVSPTSTPETATSTEPVIEAPTTTAGAVTSTP